MNWLPGDYIAFVLMLVTITALIVGHVRSILSDRRAQRQMDQRLGHPARRGQA